MNSFLLQIYEADGTFFDGECESLIVPTQTGSYGIQAGHSNVVLAIVPGVMQYRVAGSEEMVPAAVSNGVLKMEDGKALMLLDSAEHADEIDIARARRALDEAKEQMLLKGSRVEYNAAQARLARAMNRLKLKEADTK